MARNTIQNMEREKRIRSKMEKLTLEAKSDQLTGLYNRAELERQVMHFFEMDLEQKAVFFMLDIDNFKVINDLYGHERGDETLRSVAEKLRDLFREEDIICRMGGDEFAVFMKAKPELPQLVKRLDRISETLYFKVENTEVSCSIGVCLAPERLL